MPASDHAHPYTQSNLAATAFFGGKVYATLGSSLACAAFALALMGSGMSRQTYLDVVGKGLSGLVF